MNRTPSSRAKNEYVSHKNSKKTNPLLFSALKVLLIAIGLLVLCFVWRYVFAFAILLFMFITGGLDDR